MTFIPGYARRYRDVPVPQPTPTDVYNAAIEARDAWQKMAEAQAKLLTAYRLGYTGERAGKAVDAVSDARAHLEYLKQDTSKV